MPEETNDAPKDVQQEPEKKSPKTSNNLALLLGILVLLLLAGGGYLGWQMWDESQQSASQTPTPPPAPTPPAEPASPPATPPPSPSPTTPSASLRENIEASINTMNTAALEGYMTDPVTVILAGSECCGSRTPTQAVTDLDYLSGATDPWDWDLSAATLQSYKDGFYGQYFPSNAVVGKSSDNYVVSFTVNANDDISTVFMTNNAELLTQ